MSDGDLLAAAEVLEREASERRVTYFLGRVGRQVGRLLDVGCGNGYAVRAWQCRDIAAVGVDRSTYRLARWVEQHRGRRPFVLADAAALPFRDGSFDAVVSSGMIEHVGVSETARPYRVQPHADRDRARQGVVGELTRVTRTGGTTLVDCPNGAFPIDFWHGDRLGAFRPHRVPDSLLPTFGDFVSWARAAGRVARLETVTGRLAFRQVSRRWWGRLLAAPMALLLRLLDGCVERGWMALPARTYPYLVVALRADVSPELSR
ncbi:MAG TPA: class I SAM-dependent methyltransferase [Thermoanaerobaculia bacterium]|nr:class I SAM-dependent methyltransferase [Thermoanaerobaculia bacterium]